MTVRIITYRLWSLRWGHACKLWGLKAWCVDFFSRFIVILRENPEALIYQILPVLAPSSRCFPSDPTLSIYNPRLPGPTTYRCHFAPSMNLGRGVLVIRASKGVLLTVRTCILSQVLFTFLGKFHLHLQKMIDSVLTIFHYSGPASACRVKHDISESMLDRRVPLIFYLDSSTHES